VIIDGNAIRSCVAGERRANKAITTRGVSTPRVTRSAGLCRRQESAAFHPA
jgi:hypothetical protein